MKNIVQPKLLTLARQVNPFYFRFIKNYSDFYEFISELLEGKFDGDPVVAFEEWYETFLGLKPKIKKIVGNESYIQFNKWMSRIIRNKEMLNLEYRKLASKAVFRAAMKRATFVYVAMVEKVLDMVLEGSDIFYVSRIRKIKSIPINRFRKKSKEETELEQKDLRIKEELDKVAQLRRENEALAEMKAADNDHILERARIMGEVVQIGMRPEDADAMNEITSDLSVKKDELTEELSKRRSVIKKAQRLRNKAMKAGNEEVANILNNTIMTDKADIEGEFGGPWFDEEGDSGTWEAVREFIRVPGMTASATGVKGFKNMLGGWSIRGIGSDLEHVYRVLSTEKGNVKGRDPGAHISGKLYLEGGNLSGWLKIDKSKLTIGEGTMGGERLRQQLVDIKSEMNEVKDGFDRYMYTKEGEVVPANEWMKKKVAENREKSGLNNIHKIDKYIKSHEDQMVPSADIDKAIEEGTQIEWFALSDEKVPDNVALTRMFPAVNMDGQSIVADGIFKGVPLDLLINQADRFIKGTSYSVDDDGSIRPMELHTDNGELDYLVQCEPHVSVTSKNELMLVLPKSKTVIKKGPKRMELTPAFQVVKELSEYSSTVRTVVRPGSEEEKRVRTVMPISTFIVSPQDLDDIRNRIGSLTMTAAAAKIMQEYYEMRKNLSKSLLENEYGDITPESIPGFKQTYLNADGDSKPVEFRSFQKKAISYLTSRGNGLCGLDTGLGKSVVSIGTLLTWIDDGTLKESGKNGRALYVVPASLRGNIPAEVRKFCENPDEILDQVDIVSYDEFRRTDNSEIESYGAVFFDEAQEMKNATGKGASRVANKALKLNHPHKVLLTASVLEKSPADLYNLVMISDNLYNVDEAEASKQRSRFLNETCETVGGRAVGVKNSEGAIARMRDWVKTNCLYVDKQQVAEEIDLPPVTPPDEQSVSISMSPKVIEMYKSVSSEITETITRMKEKYKNKRLSMGDVNREMARGNIMGAIIRLREISNDPELYLRKHKMRELALEMFGKNIKKGDKLTSFEREELDAAVDNAVPSIPNPKLDRCIESTKSKVAQGKRVVAWTDQPTFALKAGTELAKEFPGKRIAVCLSDHIEVYTPEGDVADYAGSTKGKFCVPVEVVGWKSCGGKYTFRPSSKYVYPNGESVPKQQWQKYVMDYVLAPNPNIAVVVLTSAYATGHNLQWCSSVIHLDRDNWNNEVMKQRTARCWRQGQKEPVEVEILDATIPGGGEEENTTINEVQRWMMEIEEDLFDKVIRQSVGGIFNSAHVQFGTAQKVISERQQEIDLRDLTYVLDPSVAAEANLPGVSLPVQE